MTKITIYLGSRCNLDCAYCHRKVDEKEPVISESLLKYLKSIKDLQIRFIGGEPTLYMDEVKRVVTAVPNARFGITTNGILFDRYREYFLRHRFQVCISFDGNESLRGYDPFRKVIDYPWLAVSCTLYHGNTDFKKIIHAFTEKEKVVGRPLSFFPHIMHVTSRENEPYALTREDFISILSQWEAAVTEYVEDYEAYGVVNTKYQGLFIGLYQRTKAQYSWGESYCVNHRMGKCDASGRFASCLYIRDEYLGEYVEAWKNQKQFLSPKCRNCPVYDLCGGACIKSIQHDLECYFYRRLFAWWKAFCGQHKEAVEELGGTV